MKAIGLGEHETRSIGAPAGWNQERDGPCSALPVHDYVNDKGQPGMISTWELEEGDLEKLKQGAPIHLSVLGTVHPVVCVYVGEPPTDPGTGENQENSDG